MATEIGPDLSAGQEAVEALMDDTCVITRNDAGDTDAVLDQNTGQLVQNPASTRYEGRCLLKAPSGLVNRPAEQGGMFYTLSTYQLKLPLSELDESTEPQPGDLVLMTSSRRDPAVVGKQFRILSVDVRTMAVSRVCNLEYRG